MATHEITSFPLTTADRPLDAGTDFFSEWLSQSALDGSTAQDGDVADRLGWQSVSHSAFALVFDPGLFGDRGTQDMAREWTFDAVVTSPAAPVTLGKTGVGLPVLELIGTIATHTFGSAADTPVAAAAPNPTAPDAAALVAPQVLAYGSWLVNPQVTLKTSLGTIVVELYPNAAPVTAANYLAHTGSGFYDNLLFHRVVPGFVVQGGG